MNKEIMLEAIKEKMANKELSFGCIILDENGKKYRFLKMCESGNSFDSFNEKGGIDRFYYPMVNNKTKGHPVLIGDVLYYTELNKIDEKILKNIQRGKTYTSCYEMIRVLWKDKIKPIDDQSLECIIYIYNL